MKVRSSGYSLVELMIVVAILSILAMLAIPAYKGYITTGRQATARANIEPLRIAVEDYRLDNMAAGYAALDGLKWEPSGTKTLETGVLGWKPDGDRDEYNYAVTATATSYTITVTPIGHTADVQTFTK
ncbi:MAG: prepilin-type N-terminal cleavage/methylation domain-containing protein [Candidatus Thiodiazotropha sp.]|jgi:type IV pilus assembly protein PilE